MEENEWPNRVIQTDTVRSFQTLCQSVALCVAMYQQTFGGRTCTFMNVGEGKQFASEHSVSRIIPSCGVFSGGVFSL